MNLEKRKEAYAILANNGKIEIIDSKEEISRLHNRFEEKKERQKIIGVIASKGIVQGKVKTIRSKDEHFKIKKGDILVTEMTTPDFLIAMEKSAAIVTDIGGITSHAAIVARELGIPCIVGTENATNLLKDGDFVVVDAIDKGEVIKIDAPCIIS
jgi:pyruvate,water dikinase